MSSYAVAGHKSYNAALRPRTLKTPVRRNILIEQDVWRKLMERANAEERSASFLIRQALKKFLGME